MSRDGERIPVSKEERNVRAKTYDYYGASGVIDKIDGYLFDKPLLLIGEDGANLINRSSPIAFMARGKYWVNNHAHVIDGFSESFLRYLEVFINSTDLAPYVTGTAQPKMNQAKMNSIPVAVPPEAEQRRIVAKVDELMALCDRLEAAQKEREAARLRMRVVAASSISQRAEPGPTASFSRFSSVVARRDDIPSLRSNILRLAVQGRLLPGTATPSAAPDDGLPFSLPTGWKWSSLAALGKFKGGATPSKSNPDFWQGSIPWVSPKDMKVDSIEDARLHITQEAIDGSATTLIEPRSLLFVVRGMILGHSFPVAVTQVPVTINQDMKALVLTEPSMAAYLLIALKALKPEMLARVKRSTHGTGRIEGPDYRDFPVPLPPPRVRQFIVAKVNELMALCDQLEAHLKAGDQARSRLLDALIAEALADTPQPQSA